MGIGTVVLVMLGALAVEAVVLYVAGRRAARVPRLSAFLPNLAAGLFLVLALGATTFAEPLPAVALCALLAGLAHAWDLAARLRR